jgi:hypothetical protein
MALMHAAAYVQFETITLLSVFGPSVSSVAISDAAPWRTQGRKVSEAC